MPTEEHRDESFDGGLSAADRELEAALRGLMPTAAPLSRDSLLFEAGRRSGQRPLVFWRAATALLAVCAGSTLLVPHRTIPQQAAAPAPAVVQMPAHATAPPYSASREQFAYLQLRSLVLRDDIDALPGGGGDDGSGSTSPTIASMRLNER